MKLIKKNGFQIFQIAVVVIALFNLIALFVFDYELPGFLRFGSDSVSESTDAPKETTPPYSIQFESDTITYDGTGNLNLLDGVSVVATDGTVVESEVFAHIVTGETLSDKVITYSVDTDAGQVTATRNLTLTNYSGPSLVLPQSLPEISEEFLDSILTYMPTDGSFVAKDGFGNDITKAVSSSYTIDPANPSIVHYVFSVTNMFNDVYSVAADLTIDSTRPILLLTQNEVTIAKGTSFQPLLYLSKAVDQQGNDLSHRIRIDGTVDVNTPGSYTLTYSVTNEAGESSLPQTLVVTVE